MSDVAPPQTKALFDLRRIALAVLFFYAETPFDFHGDTMSTGYGFLTKLVFGGLSLVIVLSARPFIENRKVLYFAIAVSGYFFFCNLTTMSNLAVIQFGILFVYIVLSDFALTEFRDDFKFVLTFYLMVNLVGLVLSVTWYWTVGTMYDFHSVVFPFSAARQQLQYGLARVSGFQSEPGNYTAWVTLAVCLRCLLVRKIGTSLHAIAMASTLLTYSAWAIIGAAFFFAAAAFELLISAAVDPRTRRKVFIVLTCVAGVVCMAVVALPAFTDIVSDATAQYSAFLTLRYQSNAGSLSSYAVVLMALRDFAQNWTNALFIGRPITVSFCPTCEAVGALPGQLGVWASIAYFFGAIPSIGFAVVVVRQLWRHFGSPYILIIVAPLLSRVYFSDPMLWMVFTIILFEVYHKARDGTPA